MTVSAGNPEGVTRAMPSAPTVSGVQFFTPTQRWFRNKAEGLQPTPQFGANLPMRRLRKHPTGAASMENLEPDTDTYRAVLGEWGRPTRAGSP